MVLAVAIHVTRQKIKEGCLNETVTLDDRIGGRIKDFTDTGNVKTPFCRAKPLIFQRGRQTKRLQEIFLMQANDVPFVVECPIKAAHQQGLHVSYFDDGSMGGVETKLA